MPPDALPEPDALSHRITLALDDYEMAAERGLIRCSADVLDVAARWTISDLTAPPDADSWHDFDAIRAAVVERHTERERAW